MISKKTILIRALCCAIGITIGATSSHFIWNAKYSNEEASKKVSVSNDSLNDEFWQKITAYYEKEYMQFLDNFYNICNSSLYASIDNSLMPYYEKYGYTTVISSGLRSSEKLAQSYCIEKCCQLVGDERIDHSEILSALQVCKIDTTLVTDSDFEQESIDKVSKRLNLAKALISGSYDSDLIVKNSNGSRMTWQTESKNTYKNLRIYDNGYLYSLEDTISYEGDEISFLNDSVILISNSNFSSIVSIRDVVAEFSLNTLINEHTDKVGSSIIDNVEVKGDYIVGTFTFNEYEETPTPTPSEKNGRFELNLKTGTLTVS